MSRTSSAEDSGTLKTEYYESAINGATINYKRWNTSRDGKLIITREERDENHSGKFDQVDTLIFHDGKKVLHFFTLLGKPACFFHPEAGFTVLQSDSDGDGHYDCIVISDAEHVVDAFTLAPDGRIIPISDAKLKQQQDALKLLHDAMKKMD
jgi:hypothetical protein